MSTLTPESTRLDTSTDRGKHVAARLRDDIIAWLTTVRPNGQPDSVPVWYLWDGDSIVIFSRPNKTKLHNLEQNPRVTLTIDDTKGGGDVIRVEGIARYVPNYPGPHEIPAYDAKYANGIQHIGYDNAQKFGEHYSEAIIVTPTKYRF